MCTVVLPPGVNPIAVNKYIYLSKDVGSFCPPSLLFIAESSECMLVHQKCVLSPSRQWDPGKFCRHLSHKHTNVFFYGNFMLLWAGLSFSGRKYRNAKSKYNIYIFVLMVHGTLRNCLNVPLNPDRVPWYSATLTYFLWKPVNIHSHPWYTATTCGEKTVAVCQGLTLCVTQCDWWQWKCV